MIINFKSFKLEFKDENVKIYEDRVGSSLKRMIPIYLDADLQRDIELSTPYEVKKAIVHGMNAELELYEIQIEEDLGEVDEGPDRTRVLSIDVTNIERDKTDEVFAASYEKIIVWSDFGIVSDDIIQIGDEHFRIFQIKEISTLDKLSEQIRRQRDIYDGSEFYKSVARKVVGDEKKIYLGKKKEWS